MTHHACPECSEVMNDSIRITVNLPLDLMQRAQQLIEQGFARDHHALIVSALDNFLCQVERQEIDAQLAVMMDDAAYQALNKAILLEFEESDWEALMMSPAGNQDS